VLLRFFSRNPNTDRCCARGAQQTERQALAVTACAERAEKKSVRDTAGALPHSVDRVDCTRTDLWNFSKWKSPTRRKFLRQPLLRFPP
jgi:hypothetical protein